MSDGITESSVCNSVRESYPVNELSDSELRDAIEETVRGLGLPLLEAASLASSVYSSIRGYGPLDRLFADDSITEIMINGPDSVFIERAGRVTKTGVSFSDSEKLENIIQRIVGSAGREVNSANPIVDTRLADGSRVNVVLPPVALCGPTVTVRKFSGTPFTIERLTEIGSLTEEAAAFLGRLVRAKYNIFISGGTGSGKTTFLNALSGLIPSDERVITIEDSAELKISGIKNLVSLETRNANSAGAGQVTVRDLIRTSLRMRPERIIVGEVRGAEAIDMLQAMNTGHDGSLSTGHANSAADLCTRLETMVLMGNAALPLEAVRRQIASSLDIIIHLSRFRDRSRRVAEISEIEGLENGEIKLNPLFIFRESGTGADGRVCGALERTGRQLIHKDKLITAGIGDEI